MSAAKICQELMRRGAQAVVSLDALYDFTGLTAKTAVPKVAAKRANGKATV